MRRLKTFKLFESVEEVSKTMIEDFLREFSDNDIRVDVELYIKPGETDVKKIFINIGNEEDMGFEWGIGNYLKDILPVKENINNLTSMNDYLLDEGFNFESVDCWREGYSTQFKDFSEFLEDINNKGIYKMVEFFYKKS